MTAHHQQLFAHWISWILAQLEQNAHIDELQHSRLSFKEYSPHAPRDGKCGPRGQCLAQRTLDERALAEGRVRDEERAAEDAALDEAEANYPGSLLRTQTTRRMTRITLRPFPSPEVLMTTRQVPHMVRSLHHQLLPLRCLNPTHLQLSFRHLQRSSAHRGRCRTGY